MTRFLAWLIDLVIIAVLLNIISIAVLTLKYYIRRCCQCLCHSGLFHLLSIGYAIATEWLWNGQTVGKRVLRLRVMDVQGFHLKFNQIVIRNLLRFVDSLPATYLVGGAACFFIRGNHKD